jgi:hypothetical protein
MKKALSLACLLALCLLTNPARAALPGADDLLDLGSPKGVDGADVQALMRLVLGLDLATFDQLPLVDVAPGKLLSLPADPTPHKVRPKPAPGNDPDLGDLVLATRRAAGLIVFDKLNAPPTVTLDPTATLVSVAQQSLAGTVVDDVAAAGAAVKILQDGVVVQTLVAGANGRFAFFLNLHEGPNQVQLQATDAEGRAGALSDAVTLTLDTVKPELVISSPAMGSYFNTATIQFNGTVFDEYGVAAVLVNGKESLLIDMSPEPWLWQGSATLTGVGAKFVAIQARDAAGNLSAEVLFSLVLDFTKPTVAFGAMLTPQNTPVVKLYGTATDDRAMGRVEVNGVPATLEGDTWTVELPLEAGDNTYTAISYDKASNASAPATTQIFGDFTPPTLTLASARYTNKTPYELRLNLSEAVTLVRLGGVPDGRYFAGPVMALSGLSLLEGENQFDLMVRDAAGNVVETSFTVMLDTVKPDVTITLVYRDGFQFSPEGGVDGVITDAPAVNILGTISDPASGIEKVIVNGFEADVVEGSFNINGVSVIPRENPVTATAYDRAGNTAYHAIEVIQDIEGPAMQVSLKRGANISSSGQFNDPTKNRYNGSAAIQITGTVTDLYLGVSSLLAYWNGQALTVNVTPATGAFSFSVPATSLAGPSSGELRLVAADAFGNQNTDYRGALQGVFNLRGTSLTNAMGIALGESSVSVLSSLVESMVEGMDGKGLISQTISQWPATIDVTGLAFCNPPDDYNGGTYTFAPPACRYGCTQNVTVTMSFDAAGHVKISVVIPYMHIDAWLRPIWLLCGNGSEAYAKVEPATINMLADFVNTPTGPALQAVANSVTVSTAGVNVELQRCGLVNGILDLFNGFIATAVQDAFSAQANTLLATVGDSLKKPLYTSVNSGFTLGIDKMSNALSQGFKGLSIWLKSTVNPCTSESGFTDILNETTTDPTDYLPCPSLAQEPLAASFYNAPGSLTSGLLTTPPLSLSGAAGVTYSFHGLVNENFVNQYLFKEWAQGALAITVTQEFVGDAISLDTGAFSLFIPELANPLRTDIQTLVPTGTPIQILTHFSLPPRGPGRGGQAAVQGRRPHPALRGRHGRQRSVRHRVVQPGHGPVRPRGLHLEARRHRLRPGQPGAGHRRHLHDRGPGLGRLPPGRGQHPRLHPPADADDQAHAGRPAGQHHAARQWHQAVRAEPRHGPRRLLEPEG